jgi:F0F1-type ATP synthase epsilon subunit
MVEASAFQLNIRTPHEVILETWVRSARVLTETGHVGIRPRTEPTVLAVEAGIVHAYPVADESSHEIFIGTAGGLLMCERDTVTLLTPLAVAGDNERAIVEQIDDLMQRPNSELEARATFTKLEGHILSELRRERTEGVTQRLDQPL